MLKLLVAIRLDTVLPAECLVFGGTATDERGQLAVLGILESRRRGFLRDIAEADDGEMDLRPGTYHVM